MEAIKRGAYDYLTKPLSLDKVRIITKRALEKIAMAEGATIGAATPVAVGLPGAAPVPVAEKTVSYMRKEFAATAEARKRPAQLAEAMVPMG